MQQEFRQLLENDTGILDGMQDPTAIYREPNAHMYRMSGLTKQHGIALYRICDGFPPLPLGVVSKGGYHGAKVVGVYRNFR